jgi:ABC-type nickel/cobalt efflux system permease component RcnA
MFRKLLFLIPLLLVAPRSFAHPMGNFSVNHYSKITFERDGIKLTYIIDLAEIPTYQELQQGNVTADVADPSVKRFVESRGQDFARGLTLMLDGKRVPLKLLSSQVIFPPGAGGLPTMKMGFVYRLLQPLTNSEAHIDRLSQPPTNSEDHIDRLLQPLTNSEDHHPLSPCHPDRSEAKWRDLQSSRPCTLQYADNNYPGHAGWKEIIAVPTAGVSFLATSAPKTDRSAELTNYPTDLLNSPPQDLLATIQFHFPATVKRPAPTVRAAAPHVSEPTPNPSLQLKANQQATPRNAFTELITARHLTLWFLITAAFIAFWLGALHALEPGHGKTIVAAYLVGSRGTAWHAFLLGIIVTVSHTAGVFALGAITLYASRYIVPEQLYPWLGVFSGLTIAGLGGYMFLRRWSGLDLDHSHSHWPFGKKNEAPSAPIKSVSLYQLFALGITGGIIPCPAALVVLLSAFALHRIGLGFFLITAFSTGLAAVLISFGMLMVYGRRFVARLRMDGPLTTRWLPVASAAFMTVLGAGIAIRAYLTTSIDLHNLTKEKAGPFLFIAGLGLLLGMRHSTDPDHVVAVSTIVSKQRSIRQAGLIGSIWGLGHTLTIFAVGSLIILFGVVIPPRLGLSMEFSVALMLILLGVLNLTGVMQRMTSYLTRNGQSLDKAETLLDRSVGRFGLYQCLRPLVIGIVHGLAGSAAVALLVLSTIHSPLWATLYLLIFGAGTMVGMMCMTAVMAVPLAYAGNRFGSVSRFFSVASGVVSVCFGFFLVYQLGFLGGLFTSHPQWTPR